MVVKSGGGLSLSSDWHSVASDSSLASNGLSKGREDEVHGSVAFQLVCSPAVRIRDYTCIATSTPPQVELTPAIATSRESSMVQLDRDGALPPTSSSL